MSIEEASFLTVVGSSHAISELEELRKSHGMTALIATTITITTFADFASNNMSAVSTT